MMKQQTVVWKAVEYPGMEYLKFWEQSPGVVVSSVVIGVRAEGAFRLNYYVECDDSYTVRAVRLEYEGRDELSLWKDERGNWYDTEGDLLPDLKGCIDIDISATPFTNTLPIKRIAWTVGQTETLRMVYFLIPEMTFHVDEQRYTCLEQRADGATFRFEQLATGFTAVLPVDADGLVLDYPGLFERVKN
ncbi:MAG: putative glycolipid-binding domain-containing protein [Chloroflexota bacterium]